MGGPMSKVVSQNKQAGEGARSRPSPALIICAAIVSLALGACSKCDVPDWFAKPAGQSPQGCHGTPAPQ
jgi:hypothetical protein